MWGASPTFRERPEDAHSSKVRRSLTMVKRRQAQRMCIRARLIRRSAGGGRGDARRQADGGRRGGRGGARRAPRGGGGAAAPGERPPPRGTEVFGVWAAGGPARRR